jgi:hypothetical protein
LQKEWEEARAVLARFDNNIHDIRKYGFTFITSLLAAQALLIPADVLQSVDEPWLDNQTKFAIFLATLILINCLGILERSYNQFQKAAKVRAVIVERLLNIELTDTISDLYKMSRTGLYSIGFYIMFEASLIVLAFAVLTENVGFAYLLVVAAIAFPVTFALYERKRVIGDEWIDLTMDKHEVFPGESIRILVTNVALDQDEPIIYWRGEKIWSIADSAGNIVIEEIAKKDTQIENLRSLNWMWEIPKGQANGLYTIYRYVKDAGGNPQPTPLNRMLMIVSP